jgi:hypothetical protein
MSSHLVIYIIIILTITFLLFCNNRSFFNASPGYIDQDNNSFDIMFDQIEPIYKIVDQREIYKE